MLKQGRLVSREQGLVIEVVVLRRGRVELETFLVAGRCFEEVKRKVLIQRRVLERRDGVV